MSTGAGISRDKAQALGVLSEALRRGKYFLPLVAIVSLFISLIVLKMADRRYTSTATVLPSSRGFVDLAGASDGTFDVGLYLGLNERRSLLPLYPDILRSRLISGDILSRSYTFHERGREVTETLKEHIEVRNYDAALLILINRMTNFWIDRDTKTLVLRVTTDNPELSAHVVNAYIERLERFNRQERRSTSKEVYAFVEKKLEDCRFQLREAEEALRDFRESNRNFNISTEPGLQMEHRRLERCVELKRALFVELGKQQKKAAVDVERDTPILNVLDYGRAAGKPSWPGAFQLMLSTTIAGLCIGVVCLVGVESLRRWRSGQDRETIERLLYELGDDLKMVPFIGARAGDKS